MKDQHTDMDFTAVQQAAKEFEKAASAVANERSLKEGYDWVPTRIQRDRIQCSLMKKFVETRDTLRKVFDIRDRTPEEEEEFQKNVAIMVEDRKAREALIKEEKRLHRMYRLGHIDQYGNRTSRGSKGI